jgi:hypothetical protein
MNSTKTQSYCFNPTQELVIGSWLCAEGTRFDELAFPPTPVNETNICDLALDELEIPRMHKDSVVSSLAAGVGKILLSGIQSRLPQWIHADLDGGVFGRKIETGPCPSMTVSILPVELLEINWATSGPGIDWPERYYACPLPEDNITVVTASTDSPDVHQCTDWALGWFAGYENITENSGVIIRKWWWIQNNKFGQLSWESFRRAGCVRKSLGHAWRNEVWSEN